MIDLCRIRIDFFNEFLCVRFPLFFISAHEAIHLIDTQTGLHINDGWDDGGQTDLN